MSNNMHKENDIVYHPTVDVILFYFLVKIHMHNICSD